jgi:hypothetical protein
VNAVSGRVYIAQHASSNDANFWTWSTTTGLSTIISGSNGAGAHRAMDIDYENEMVYFGEADESGGNFYAWSPTTGLSTLLTGFENPGYEATIVDQNTHRVFFSDDDSAGLEHMWTWSPAGSTSSVGCD